MVRSSEPVVLPPDHPVMRCEPEEEGADDQIITFCGVTFSLSEIRRIDLSRDGNIIRILPAPEVPAMGFNSSGG